MELHELESAWKTLDARVAQQDVELRHLRRQNLGMRMGGKLLRASLGQWAQLAGALDVDVETRQQLDLVQRAMSTLGHLDRALLLLHLEGCSHRESAEVLGTTEGNVATRLNRIKSHLRREVADA